jgi:DNA-directed RNA polymerase subunit RPC12/RpoP
MFAPYPFSLLLMPFLTDTGSFLAQATVRAIKLLAWRPCSYRVLFKPRRLRPTIPFAILTFIEDIRRRTYSGYEHDGHG